MSNGIVSVASAVAALAQLGALAGDRRTTELGFDGEDRRRFTGEPQRSRVEHQTCKKLPNSCTKEERDDAHRNKMEFKRASRRKPRPNAIIPADRVQRVVAFSRNTGKLHEHAAERARFFRREAAKQERAA